MWSGTFSLSEVMSNVVLQETHLLTKADPSLSFLLCMHMYVFDFFEAHFKRATH